MTLRLTLRTLLAYLDDTLEPAEIKQIGQKVAESDTARELIERIKQVTRKRRLTTPPTSGPASRFDANIVSEYLDNVLPSEQVAEIEKICLESDVHLAEIAACHQILTLVLGEPVLVPPPARRRMYGLVHGQGTNSRKATARKPTNNAVGSQADGHDADDTLLLGLPPLSRISSKWLRWLVPIAAVLLLAALGTALWMAIPHDPSQVAQNTRTPREKQPPAPAPKEPAVEPEPELLVIAPRLEAAGTIESKQPTEPIPVAPVTSKPNTERKVMGKAIQPGPVTPSVLLQRQPGKDIWKRLRPEIDPVYSSDMLVSLPGFRSEVRLDNKVQLVLWGNVHQAIPMPLLESAVVLHAVATGEKDAPDVDLTVDRGRILLINQRAEPSKVRIRFHDEIWDVTLEDQNSEVGMESFGVLSPSESGEGPLNYFGLIVLKGNARLKVGPLEYALKAPPGPTAFQWVSRGPTLNGPLSFEQILPSWTKAIATTKEQRAMEVALDALSLQLKDKIAAQLYDTMGSVKSEPASRVLATLSLGAIDALPEMLDALDMEQFPDVRTAAAESLQHWLGRKPGQEQKLKQALLDKRYTNSQADIIVKLLHPFGREDLAKKETYEVLIEYLRNSRPAVRQLAYMHLVRQVPEEAKKIPYDAGRGGQQQQDAYDLWQDLLTKGKLPPKLPIRPPMPPMPPG